MLNNPSKLSHLSDIHQAAMKLLASKYKEKFGEKLKSIYVYGSVARGTAKPTSDLDNVAIVDMPADILDSEDYKVWKKQIRQEIHESYPELWDIDVHPISTVTAKKLDWVLMVKLDGVLFEGEDFYKDEQIPTDPKIFVQALFKRYYDNVPKYWKKFKSDEIHEEKDVIFLSRYFAKVALRLGMALVLLQQEDISFFTNGVEEQRDLIIRYLNEFTPLSRLAYDLRYTANKEESVFIDLATQLERLMDRLEPYMDFA